MNKQLLFLALIVLSLLSCNQKTDPTTITLITPGYPDSTMLFLANDLHQVDTGYVINNKLVFTVPLTTAPSRYGLFPVMKTRADFDVRSIWKENKALIIHASKGNLKNAIIEGSEIQKDADELRALKQAIEQKQDSLNSLIYSLDPVKDSIRRQHEITEIRTTYPIEFDLDSGFMYNHPNSLYSAYTLKNNMKELPTQTVKFLYDHFSATVQASSDGLVIKKYLAIAKDVKIGDPAIDFSLPNLEGHSISLSSFKGKYLLLEFWATGCGPCRMENPNLLRNYKKYHAKGFDILGVTFDTKKEEWGSTVKSDSMIWNTVGDLKGFETDIALIYKVYMIPTNYLINPEGIIIAKDLRREQLGLKLDSIFASKSNSKAKLRK